MDTELSVTQERLDDVPLIFAMARQLGLRESISNATTTTRGWAMDGLP